MTPRYTYVRAKARNMVKDIKSPPVPIFDIARSVAPVVYSIDGVIHDALCLYAGKHGYRIFVEVGSVVPERMNYSLAHEVAHVVLNHHAILIDIAKKKGIKVKGLFLPNSVPELETYLNAFEREAEIFAAELLMPERWLRHPRRSADFENLRRALGVSKQALIIRLDETGIMPRHILEPMLRRIG